jgi:arylsulfatase A-like enzyme
LPAAAVCREPLVSCDFLPMAVIAAGGRLPEDRMLDGRDPTAALAGTAASPHEALYFEFRKHSAMRRGRYKIVRSDPGETFQLFDLQEDAGETTDLAARHPELAATMQREFEAWRASVGRD